MQFALNLPFEHKVASIPKPLIRDIFLQDWTEDLVLPKKGFSGHCNDSLPYLNINVMDTDRNTQWRHAVIDSFFTPKNYLDLLANKVSSLRHY